MKRVLKMFLRRIAFLIKPMLESFLQFESWIAISWVASAHKRLMEVQWRFPPEPEHFNHHIDLFYQWLESRNSLWLERGVFGSLALRGGGDLLELACGDGFNAKNFYSLRTRHVVACDFNPKAIGTATKKNSAPNVEYVLADIRTAMPKGEFENIVWDNAIEHFTLDEIEQILKDIKTRLTSKGILIGSTIVENPDATKFSHHEYEPKSKEDLLRFFTPHFYNVTVFETIYPNRHNLYFWASDGSLPFRSGWSSAINKSGGVMAQHASNIERANN